ncbi:MATE family efflux transporter [Vibrio sp. Of7-15]|uniref:MATE family efflux transporter n=1 Tax=Vibrio sp. Of7-15 TaxID=2724879 RepID=UPI001EF36446|nr:MATE family efflux transporter [Vibrio sp. Of7-15]MCG7499999.1 MATE family efflux transporter [Vibrio sp. Of7-15]
MLTWKTAADRNFWQKTWRLAIPVSLQSMMFAVLGLVDIMMVSQLGEEAVAAVGVGNRIFFFNLLLIVGVSGAVGVLASQYFGAGRMDGVRKTLAQSWVLAIVLTLPFMMLYLFLPREIVSFVTDNTTYIEYAEVYLFITGATILTPALVIPLESALRSVGHARVPTIIGLLAVVLNAALNALLIFGLFGLPEMGVMGAALGTSISRVVQTIMLFWITKRSYNDILPKQEDWIAAKKKSARDKYCSVAWPMVLHDAGWAVGILVYNIIVGRLGVSELAIISLLAPIEGVLISAFIGFSVAASTILGHELGAENYQRAWYQSWWLVFVSAFLALLVGIICAVFNEHIRVLLEKANVPDVTMALKVTLVLAFGLALKVYNMVGIAGVLRSGGDIKYSIFIDLFAQWAVGIPLAFYTGLYLGWPLHWVMLIILSEEVVKVLLTTQRIRVKRWLNNLVNDDQALPESKKEETLLSA